MWSLTQSVHKLLALLICSLLVVSNVGGESIVELSEDDPVIDNLQHSSLVYGIFKEIRLNEESECAQDAKIILDGIRNRDVWALKSIAKKI